MHNRSSTLNFLFERIVPWIVLMILAFYTYARFFVVPYAGFDFSMDTVILVFDEEMQKEQILPGDRLLRVGPLRWEDFLSDLRKTAFEGYKPGQNVPILIDRGGQELSIQWTYTGPTREQVIGRLNEHWWLPFVFWFAGMATLLYIRPKEIRWQTLICMYFLTATWYAAGSGNSHAHVWGSSDVLYSAVFLSVPIYLHFHWVFPRPLFNLPSLFWRILYAGSILFVVLGWFQLVPSFFFYSALALLPAGSILLLIAHAIFQKEYRGMVFLLAAGIAIVLVPPVVFNLLSRIDNSLRASTFIALPAFPAAYFFAIYWLQYKGSEKLVKRLFNAYVLAILVSTGIVVVFAYYEDWFGVSQPYSIPNVPSAILSLFIGLMGVLPFLVLPAIPKSTFGPSSPGEHLELRSNRLVSVYMFFTPLVVTLFVLVVLTVTALPLSRDTAIAIAMVAVILAITTTYLGFERFRRFVERRLLGIPLPPMQLLENYSASITTSLDGPRLTQLLRDELLPSLLVRQSALLRLEEGKHLTPLYSSGIGAADLPSSDQLLPYLENRTGSEPFSPLDNDTRIASWVRMVFPLRVRDELIGLWLLGRRDPDDTYSPSELPVLQSIANQTAVALANIQQAELLRNLYQANIEQQESGDSALALFLHDEVLNSLAHLMDQVEPGAITPRIQQIYNRITTNLRQTVQGLHPTMLIYGLSIGLEDLVDDLKDRAGENLCIEMQVPVTDTRHDPRIEQHLYRIVQQACENVLRHAQARTLMICGRIDPDHVILEVIDDGIGFPADEKAAFSSLIAKRHYGLFGMYQRAGFIGARIRISSVPGAGTRVSVSWTPETLSKYGDDFPVAAHERS